MAGFPALQCVVASSICVTLDFGANGFWRAFFWWAFRVPRLRMRRGGGRAPLFLVF